MAELTEEQLRTIVATAVAAALAARPAPRTKHNEVPGGSSTTDTWDFSEGHGFKLFINSTKAIEPLFNGEQSGFKHFLRQINDRAETFGWKKILDITTNATAGVTKSLTLNYGALTHAQVKADVELCCYEDESHSKQGSIVLRKLITASISRDLYNRLLQNESNCLIRNNDNPPKQRESGVLMLHELIGLVSVQTRATVAIIIRDLNNLDMIMEAEKDHNIVEFNTKVTDLLNDLRARDIVPPDITTNLFSAHKLVADQQFSEHIVRKEEDYEDGTTTKLSAEDLMSIAREKYKTINKRNEWKKKSKKELEFIAMFTELKHAKQQLVQNKSRKDKQGGDNEGRPKHAGREQTGIFAWKNVAPAPGEPRKKDFKGKACICCPHHPNTKWVLETNRRGQPHVDHCSMKHKAENEETQLALAAVDDATAATDQSELSDDSRTLAQALMNAINADPELSQITFT